MKEPKTGREFLSYLQTYSNKKLYFCTLIVKIGV